jgi:predicted transcriptional regulator
MASKTRRITVTDAQQKQETIAATEECTNNQLVNQAINQFLEFHEWQKEKVQRRLDKTKSPNAIFHSSESVDSVIAAFKS